LTKKQSAIQKPAKNKPQKQSNFNQNKPKNKQPASLQKKQPQIHGKNASLAKLVVTLVQDKQS